MKVYRIVCKEELCKILNKDKFNLGSNSLDFSKFNTHGYEKNKKYMHFFLSKKALKHFTPSKKYSYICTFNIPIYTLIKNYGIGYYDSLNPNENRGYDNVQIKEKEFAIKVDDFNPNWLINFENFKIEKENKF